MPSNTFHSATEHSSKGLVWYWVCEISKRETKKPCVWQRRVRLLHSMVFSSQKW